MKIWIESETECTVDGVGLLKPGEPVAVDSELFKVFHGKTPAEANFPRHITVTYEVEPKAEQPASAEEAKEAK